jgi:hypothetical protein
MQNGRELHRAIHGVEGSAAKRDDRVAEVEAQHEEARRVEFEHAAEVEREADPALVVEVGGDLAPAEVDKTRSGFRSHQSR